MNQWRPHILVACFPPLFFFPRMDASSGFTKAQITAADLIEQAFVYMRTYVTTFSKKSVSPRDLNEVTGDNIVRIFTHFATTATTLRGMRSDEKMKIQKAVLYFLVDDECRDYLGRIYSPVRKQYDALNEDCFAYYLEKWKAKTADLQVLPDPGVLSFGDFKKIIADKEAASAAAVSSAGGSLSTNPRPSSSFSAGGSSQSNGNGGKGGTQNPKDKKPEKKPVPQFVVIDDKTLDAQKQSFLEFLKNLKPKENAIDMAIDTAKSDSQAWVEYWMSVYLFLNVLKINLGIKTVTVSVVGDPAKQLIFKNLVPFLAEVKKEFGKDLVADNAADLNQVTQKLMAKLEMMKTNAMPYNNNVIQNLTGGLTHSFIPYLGGILNTMPAPLLVAAGAAAS